MGISLQRFFGRLDKVRFGHIQVWDFSFRSVVREYAWLFFLKAVLAHPVKAAAGIRRYRRFIREKKQSAAEYPYFLFIPEEAHFFQHSQARKSRPLVGFGFCLKPIDPDDPSRSCPSGRANHDCLYLERGETQPACADCAIHDIGRLALETGCPVYIMTSAKDIAQDFMIPQISRDSFPSTILLLCPYSIQSIILPLLICGVEMFLLPYSTGSCADYGQWLKADKGIKVERTVIDEGSRLKIFGFLKRLEDEGSNETQGEPYGRFRRSGNIFYLAR